MRGWRYPIVLGVAALIAADCGSSATARDGGGGRGGADVDGTAGGPAQDAAVDPRPVDAEDGGEDGGEGGAIHVAWVLESAGGSRTDCISAHTSNIGVVVTNAAQTPVLSNTYYCVDMAETVGAFAPGDYLIQLSLFDITSSLAATASATATVTAGGVVDAGTLTLVLRGP